MGEKICKIATCSLGCDGRSTLVGSCYICEKTKGRLDLWHCSLCADGHYEAIEDVWLSTDL
eukprot:4114650-Amphidinium_carterae.1